MTAADEQWLHTELEDVRTRIVDLWGSGDAMTGRELVGTVAGTLLLGIGLLFTGVGAFPVDGYADYGAEDAGFLVVGLLLVAAAARCFRSTVTRRMRMYAEVRRLRRRERELVGMLPPGTAGPSSYRLYYRDRFGHPAVLVLYAFSFIVLLMILLT